MIRNPKRFKEGDLVSWSVPRPGKTSMTTHGVVTHVEHRYPRDMFGNGNYIEQEWLRVLHESGSRWVIADRVLTCNDTVVMV